MVSSSALDPALHAVAPRSPALLRPPTTTAPPVPARVETVGKRALHRLRDPRVQRQALLHRGPLRLGLELVDQPKGDPADVAALRERPTCERLRRRRWRSGPTVLAVHGDPDVPPLQPPPPPP